MWELDCKESWAPKSWCFWTVVLEKTLRVPWTTRKSNQFILKIISPCVHWKDWCWSWDSVLWPPDAKSWLIWKDPDAGKDWGQLEKGTMRCLYGITDSMDMSLGKLRSWWWTGRPCMLQSMVDKELDMTEPLNWKLFYPFIMIFFFFCCFLHWHMMFREKNS